MAHQYSLTRCYCQGWAPANYHPPGAEYAPPLSLPNQTTWHLASDRTTTRVPVHSSSMPLRQVSTDTGPHHRHKSVLPHNGKACCNTATQHICPPLGFRMQGWRALSGRPPVGRQQSAQQGTKTTDALWCQVSHGLCWGYLCLPLCSLLYVLQTVNESTGLYVSSDFSTLMKSVLGVDCGFLQEFLPEYRSAVWMSN